MQNSLCRIAAAVALLCGLAVHAANAAPPPAIDTRVLQSPQFDPAAADKERERREARRLQEQPKVQDEVIQDNTIQQDETQAAGPTFELMSVRFTESDYLSREQLLDIISPWLGQNVTFADLQKLVDAVNKRYRVEGVYTATAVLPPQRIEGGLVLIRLIEGKLGGMRFEGNDYTGEDYIMGWIGHETQDKTIDVSALEADLLQYNRINSQVLQAELRAGESFGLTDIVIRVQEPARDSLDVSFDNYGFESNGEEELSALYQRQSLWMSGDRSLAYLLISEGSQSLSLGYNAPVGASGWRLGGSLLHSKTKVIAGDFKDIDVKGGSTRVNFDSSYLALSETEYWLSLLFGASSTRSKTDVETVALSKYQTHQAQLGAEINWLTAAWQAYARQMFSHVKADDQLLSSDQGFNTSNTLLTLIHSPSSNWYGLFDLEGQYTSQRGVNGSQAFSLGGPTTLRGYSPGLVSGDYGWYQQSELHYTGIRERSTADVFVFYDYGLVRSLNPSQKLASAGVGITLAGNPWLRSDFTLGKALKEMVPGQDDWAAYLRFTCSCLN